MGIVYVECCERRHHCCCDCCDDHRDRCPNPVGRNESGFCEGLRVALAGRSVVTVGPPPTPAIRFRFFNQAIRYNPNFCPTAETGFRTPTVGELQQIVGSLTTGAPNNTPLCPMLVWATYMGEPVLVRVYPETGTIGEIITPSSWRCRAYPICVSAP